LSAIHVLRSKTKTAKLNFMKTVWFPFNIIERMKEKGNIPMATLKFHVPMGTKWRQVKLGINFTCVCQNFLISLA
jgi:hypothetical protein